MTVTYVSSRKDRAGGKNAGNDHEHERTRRRSFSVPVRGYGRPRQVERTASLKQYRAGLLVGRFGVVECSGLVVGLVLGGLAFVLSVLLGLLG